MACGSVRWVNALDRIVARLEVLGQLFAVEDAPVHEIRVGEDGSVARGLDLFPVGESAMPGLVESIERAVFLLEPCAEAGHTAGAIAEHGFRLVTDACPVERRGLAPEAPCVERGTSFGVPRHLAIEVENGLAHAEMIEAISGRGLRGNGLAVLSSVAAVRVFGADPFGRGVDVDLDFDAEAGFVGELQKQI